MTGAIPFYNNTSTIINYYKPSLYSIIILYFKYNINVLINGGCLWHFENVGGRRLWWLEKVGDIDIYILSISISRRLFPWDLVLVISLSMVLSNLFIFLVS